MLIIDWKHYQLYEGEECVVSRISGGLDFSFPLHTHCGQSELMIVVEGEVRHMVNGRSRNLAPGHIIFIRETDRHRLAGKGVLILNIAFRSRLMQELIDFSAADIPAEFSAPTAAPAEMPLSPQQLKTAIAFAEKLTGRSDRQKMFLCEFLLWFFRMHIEKRDEKIRLPVEAPEWLRSLLQQIESYRGKPADLKTLLALSAKSQEHLCRTFHRFLGMPPSRYIHSLRMKQAREHLLHSNYSIIDIAYETGYDSLGYFYKIFRQTHGCSPGEYRRRVSRNPYLQ